MSEDAVTLKEFFLSRLDAMDKAIKVAHEDIVRVPTDVDKAVKTLKDLHEEKFAGIKQRFIDNKLAIDAALIEKEKAINKSEASITKQIDAVSKQIDDVKERLGKMETAMSNTGGQSTGREKFWGYIIGGIGLLAVIVSIFISLK